MVFLGLSAIDLAHQLWMRPTARKRAQYLLSPDGVVDPLGIIPVPLAFLVGLPSGAAWLLGSLWVLKLTRFVPRFSLLGRVIALEARPLASVLVIFLIFLIFSSVCPYFLEWGAAVIVRRGRPGDCMYFIVDGEVEVRVEPHPVRLGAGQFFGEIALLEGGPRTATVVTTCATTLLALGVSEFRSFTAVHPEVAGLVESEAAKRLSKRPPARPEDAAELVPAPHRD